MSKKRQTQAYLIQSADENCILIEEELYKNDGQTFSIETRHRNPHIIVPKKPALSTYNAERGMLLSEIIVQHVDPNKSVHLRIPEFLTASTRKAIEGWFAAGADAFSLGQYDELKDYDFPTRHYTIYGAMKIARIPVREIVLYTSQIERTERILSNKEFKNYRANGVPQRLIDEMTQDTDCSEPLYSDGVYLSVNDAELSQFPEWLDAQHETFQQEHQRAQEVAKKRKKGGTRLEYALVYEAWIKRAKYGIVIYEEFDWKKLQVAFFREDKVFGGYTTIFEISYAGAPLEFFEHWGANADDLELIDSSGQAYDFEVIDDDDDEVADDEHEDDEDQ